ncbi:UNVERIFIED_CONTAM: Retrovirus-related Pol polyprotein from type-2 retrotransposable element R2DM [Sesamum radiatum]|uniref:Retrovirus-related Pol polyprotein from type-2 retrotransposable element R2DM n=1 Tax=Sesamum radiatum TaxID=300843 RepID=A0AAW2IJD9_SESRA
MLRQRAKLNWITHGDQCSKFFFSKINARRAMQRVYQIQNTAGQLVSESAQVASEFISFFQSLLGGTRTRRTLNLVFLQPHLQHTLTSEEASALLLPVSQAEVKAAFFDISVDSAPGPDGYTSAFFKAAWPVIGNDICAAVAEFFISGQLLKQLNATLLVLIPKVQLPVRVSEFRPIACCNVMYKAIAKIIVGRIQPVLHSLINYSQNAFVPGRSVADNVLLAQELMAGYNQAKLPQRCTIKIDIQKAYDSVDWDFLLESLRVFNFPAQFIQLIEQCLTSAMFSISLNGSVHGFFKGSRGLRQGDPMSPYLFVMVMELWHVLLKFRTQDNSDFRFHWKCTVNSVRAIKSVLTEFSELSGLHINPGKSTIILSKSVQRERQHILDLIGFQEGSLPIKYLGVPLTSSRLTVADCQPLIDRLTSRLAGWNHLNLSLAGRTQLIKSVLSSLHLYWASVFILPKSIIKVIESKLRSFLWKGSGSSGLAKVAWAQVCKAKEDGGLGIRSVLHMNQALMLKHVWRILQEDPRSIWVSWVLRYRLRNQTIWTYHSASASWCWNKLVKISLLLKNGLEYRVGDGGKFRLWTDIWHPRGPLICSFPRGPRITGLPSDSLLMAVIHHGQWRWPSESDFDIQEIVASLPPIGPQQTDVISWKSGQFTTKSVLALLQPASTRVLWHQLLGGKFKIPRHDFILWLAILGRLSTMDRIWAHSSDMTCILCGGQTLETHFHLFFDCSFARRCLAILRAGVRFFWPHMGWDRDVLWAARRWRGQHLINAAHRALLASIVYNLWRERNGRRFSATASSAESVAFRALEDVRIRIISANELFSGYNQRNLPPRCALKVDLRKAYDTVEWDFLKAALTLFGFPERFIQWIAECVTTPSYSVCINGAPHGFFRGARGLRQGDPMSPFLFVLVMEVLTLILRQRIEQNGGFLLHWRCEAVQLFQLSFADDLLLFSKAEPNSIQLFKDGLIDFAELSGLQANLQKSHLILSRSAAASGIPYWLYWTSRKDTCHFDIWDSPTGLEIIYFRLSADPT